MTELSSDATRRAREHLVAHGSTIRLPGCPRTRRSLAALVHGRGRPGGPGRSSASPEAVLRMSILQLEERRLEREDYRRARAGRATTRAIERARRRRPACGEPTSTQ